MALKKKDFIEIEFTGKIKGGEVFDSNIKKDLEKLNHTIMNCFTNINDALCLYSFEFVCTDNKAEEICVFLKKLNKDCIDSGKKVSLIIDFKNLNKINKAKLIEVLKEYAKEKSEIEFIFDLSAKELQIYSKFFEKVIKIWSE